MASGNFEILEGYPTDVVAFSARGTIGRPACEETLIPLIEERLNAGGKVSLVCVIGEAFEGFTAGAMWEDAKLGLLHRVDFARIAVVTDVDWIRLGIKLLSPLMRGEVRLFHVSDQGAVKAWITDHRSHDKFSPQVAADRKLPVAGSTG